MSLNAAAIRAMADKGLSGADIAEIAEAMEVRADPTAAERQRRFRAKQHNERDTVTRDVTRDWPPYEVSSTPPEITPVEAKASTAPRGRADRGSKIPDDWQAPPLADLTPEARLLAEQWPQASYRAEAEAFQNYWVAEPGAKARKTDWRRAWANRVVAVHSKVTRAARAQMETRNGHRSDDNLSSTERAVRNVVAGFAADEQRASH